MPVFWVNGGELPSTPTTSQLAAYNAALAKPPGDQNAQEQQTIAAVQAGTAVVAGAWQDSGGSGGRQQARQLEIVAFAGKLEGLRRTAINEWAKTAAQGGPQARKAQSEMHSADTSALVDLFRKVIELEDRLADSPY